MSVPTVNVTCTAADQNGKPVAFAQYTARLDRTVVYQGFVVPDQVEAVANDQGIAVLALFPNTLGVDASYYTIKAVSPNTGKKFLVTTLQVPNSACNLHDILMTGPFPAVGPDSSTVVYNAFQGALTDQATSLIQTQTIVAQHFAFT